MMTTALEIAHALGNDPMNPYPVVTWEQRARIAREFNLAVLQHMGKRTLFVVRFPGLPFIKKTITWAWLLKPMLWLFDKAVSDMPPVDEKDVAG